MRRHTAPWTDLDGNPIHEGDRIVLESGDSGIVMFFPDEQSDVERWSVDYGHGTVRSLSEEVSRAVVLDETGKYF